jgi:hypothetical protein
MAEHSNCGPERRAVRRAVPAAPGVTLDTSPRNGCRIATKVAIGELARNGAASRFPLTVVSAQELEVPMRELADFIRRHTAGAGVPSVRNQEGIHAHTTH